MVHNRSWFGRLFDILNHFFLIALSLICIFPLLHVLAISFSNSISVGEVFLWPVGFTTDAYKYVLDKPDFIKSVLVTVQRVLIGVPFNMLMVILLAYPLSKDNKAFPLRTLYAWFLVFTILFNGGLIPNYLAVRYTSLLDTIWALVLPNAVPVFNVLLLLNFFRNLPKELEEAALIDGAGHWATLIRIYLPLSLPALATITLFSTVGHWNAWFDGMIYMNSPLHYPLQTYLRTIVIELDFTSLGSEDILNLMNSVSERTTRAAQIFLGALPILVVYPFLQRFFIKGIVLGSVKE
ncbi:carbohydrate ABC transporter permease [Paenibacillus nasutitermitis]|uniref:Protein LplC n=1 Tax=Paenibacillus nasutitermitis TaxID=1652958 RepID=A0A916YTB2_9BACL|nr:carbohydrate ABC transporter permease [Paenibacillus nasutitermitis]GGD59574.1 protein LplC [Paenibacillus nasutitermitis]